MAKLDQKVEQRIARAPFIELQDTHFEYLLIDFRRIISVRGPGQMPNYKSERNANAVIVIDGLPSPLIVDDEVDLILDLIQAAAGKAPVPFITLTFVDDTAIHVDARRIVAVKECGDAGDSFVYASGYSNRSDVAGEGVTCSFIVKNSVDEIINMIRKV